MEKIVTAVDKNTMRSVNLCKILMEKIKLCEIRLVKLETEKAKDCAVKKPFEDQTVNINNTYNILEEMKLDDLKIIKKMNLQGSLYLKKV